MSQERRILVTGASGYVGGRLVRALLNEGLQVRVSVRDKNKISGQIWANEVEVAVGNATNFDEMRSALDGVHTAFYLLHSIGVGAHFEELEAEMARNFAKAAEASG
ncbi:MAG: NAD(P)H-binding protein, partial [Candidatus Nanopelagicaceae bacterium]